MANNVESNNIYINTIPQALYPGILAKKKKAYRLYYFGYIINLYTQAFIIGVNVKNIYKDLAAAYHDQDFKKIKLL